MFTACWSVKGGSGTTVVSAGLAVLLARSSPGVRLVDLAGDAPAVLGIPDPPGPGIYDWLAAGPDVPTDALDRLEVPVGRRLSLLPAGDQHAGIPDAGAGGRLSSALAEFSATRPVVADCGSHLDGPGLAVAATAPLSLLVMRPCYLALRRALAAPIRPSAIVLVSEPGRSLGRADIEDVLGVPVRVEIAMDASVARVVDAGLLAERMPRALERALRNASPLAHRGRVA